MKHHLPTDPKARKEHPIARGVLDYFPLAMAEIAHVSKVGNDQHNPGEPMHWARGKSTDHADCIVRHLIDRGKMDSDGLRHTAKVAWRALALLQEELEAEREKVAFDYTLEEGYNQLFKDALARQQGKNLDGSDRREAVSNPD